jgi:hypothetical protein
MYQFVLPTLLIKDPDLMKQVTVKEFDHFVNHRQIADAQADPFWNKNLFASRDERWRDMRSTLSPSFTSNKMRIMYKLIEECALQFVEYFQNQSEDVVELQMKDAFTRYTNDVIATTAFGVKCDSLKDKTNKFYMMGKDASDLGGWKILKFFAYGLSPTLARVCVCYPSKKILIDSSVSVVPSQGHFPGSVQLLFENNRRDCPGQERTTHRPSRHDPLVVGGAERAPTPRRRSQSQ